MLAKVRSKALDLLARREHSMFELEQKLSKKNFDTSDIKEVLCMLSENGLQSDDRFTESYIRMRSKKGFGPIRIKLELRERGVDGETAEGFLVSSDSAWFELAKISRSKKFGRDLPKELNEKARQIRYLSYKGFSSDHINRALKNEEDI